MRASDWKRLVRPLVPDTEHWQFRGPLCYRLPVDRVLWGVMGEGSGFDKGLYVWRVVMPLFIPSDKVTLSWSERIGGAARKYDHQDHDALAAAVKSAIEGLGDEKQALTEIRSKGSDIVGNRRVDEVVAYCELLQGDLNRASLGLALAGSGVATSPWEQRLMERVQLIGQLLERGPDRAVAQLDQWCHETAGALGLQRNSSP